MDKTLLCEFGKEGLHVLFQNLGSYVELTVTLETISSTVLPSHRFQISVPRILSDSITPSEKRTEVPTSVTSSPFCQTVHGLGAGIVLLAPEDLGVAEYLS